MNYLHALGSSLGNFGDLTAVAVLILGTLLGVFVGVVPGLGGIVLLVVLLPFLYHISPVIALALLLGSHSAIYYAGSTTAILINTPGAPESAATCIDGYAMTEKGHVGRALGISAAATTFGGWFGAVALMVAIPAMVPLVNLFHPPEYFFLTILAVVLIGQLQSGSPTKGILSGLFGFLLSFVGAAASTGSLRFTFGSLSLYSGINIAAAAIGLFAISQMFIMFASNKSITGKTDIRLTREVWADVGRGVRDVLHHPWLTTKSAVIGVVCGIIPGIGSTAANFLSYGYAMQSSKHPERFGTGTPEGIIAPEGSSISKEAGALIPTVALGVPNGPAMAVLLAAFSILGLAPGPSMLHQHLSLVFWMVVVIAVSSLLASLLGLGLAPILAQITVIPGRVLVPFVLVLAAIGTFASTTELFMVGLMMAFGGVGLIMRRYNYSLPAVIVGLVLGATAEDNLILTHSLYGWRFFERPLTDVIIVAIVLVIVLGVRRRRRERLASLARQGLTDTGETLARPSTGEIVVDAIWVVGTGWYMLAAAHYPFPADLAPLILGGAAFLAGLLQLVGAFVPSMRRLTHGEPSTGMHLIPMTNMGANAAVDDDLEPIPVSAGPAGPGAHGGDSGLEPQGSVSVAAVPEASVETMEAPVAAEETASDTSPLRLLAAVGLAALLVAGIYLFGYRVAVPAWTLGYFLFVRRWKPLASIIAAAAMFGAFYLASLAITSVLFPTGII